MIKDLSLFKSVTPCRPYRIIKVFSDTHKQFTGERFKTFGPLVEQNLT